jgi:HSP20 family protein
MPELKDAPRTTTDGAKGQATGIAGGAEPAPPAAAHGGPFEAMRRFAEEMDRLFEDSALASGRPMPELLTRGHELLRRETGLVSADWSPRVDILEGEGRLVIRADLPGLTRDDVEVEVGDDTLTIRGERRREKKGEREGYSYSECSYDRFFRAIPLTVGADTSKATAEFRGGVLEVAMPVAPVPKERARVLEVREGK